MARLDLFYIIIARGAKFSCFARILQYTSEVPICPTLKFLRGRAGKI